MNSRARKRSTDDNATADACTERDRHAAAARERKQHDCG